MERTEDRGPNAETFPAPLNMNGVGAALVSARSDNAYVRVTTPGRHEVGPYVVGQEGGPKGRVRAVSAG